ncbi:hypothetical protein ACFQX4_10105 [Roseomonas sp. GCM10028921]
MRIRVSGRLTNDLLEEFHTTWKQQRRALRLSLLSMDILLLPLILLALAVSSFRVFG